MQKSLQRLAKESSASYIRFFGKIRGVQSDYYIAETIVDGGEDEGGEDGQENSDEPKDADMEEKGTGVNRYTYFVTENAFSSWKKLPSLAPKHIQGARSVKILFTGDLEKQIICNPYFFGKEKHYLRAQIARISHSTTVVPAGSKKLVEDNNREIVDNEPEDGELILPNTSQMGKAD